MFQTLIFMMFFVVVAVIALAFISRRYLQVDTAENMVVYATTVDGWRIALHRYQPAEPAFGATPILLVPPVTMSAAIFDLRDSGLARFLMQQGYDVWAIDLRGRGGSSRPRLWGRYPRRWTFDDYVEFDIPAALAEITGRTGVTDIYWIGVGLGAVAMASVAARLEGPSLAGGVMIAAPAHFRRQSEYLAPWVLRLAGHLPLRMMAQAVSLLCGHVQFPLVRWLQNPDSIEGMMIRRYMANAVFPPALAEVEQYGDWIERDVCVSAAEQTDFRHLLRRLETPTLLLCGPGDRFAPPSMVQQTFDAIGATDKQLRVVGRMHGASVNYGHLDLILGKSAARDVFTPIADWIRERKEDEQ